MALDSVLLGALVREIRQAALSACVDKVLQPSRDEIILSLRTKNGTRQLALSLNPGFPGIYFTRNRRENPSTPPMFCMLLRKHLTGGRITAVEQQPGERIVTLRFSCLGEFGEREDRLLIAELMGRRTNLVLAKEDGMTLDCLKRVTPDDPAGRRMLPGLLYEAPKPMDRVYFLSDGWDAGELERLLETVPPVQALTRAMGGLSSFAASQICCSAGAGEQEWDRKKVLEQALAFRQSLLGGAYKATLINQGAEPWDIYYTRPVCCPPGKSAEAFDSFSGMMDAWYARRTSAENIRRLGKDLRKYASGALKREQRKLEARMNELAQCADRDSLRKDAELIIGNIYRMKKGESTLTAPDYSTDGEPMRTVRLDPLKTPQQNAAAYFKEYKKAGAAIEHLTVLAEQGKEQIFYLESVVDEIDRASSARELEEIRYELARSGVIREKKKPGKQKSVPATSPYKYISDSGYEILVGRNNTQNDALTFKTARKDDLWLHVKDYHGSHVIVRCAGADPDSETLELAASLAVMHSQAEGRAAVDITRVRYVKKTPGAKPGMVTFSNNTTVIAQASPELLNLRSTSL